MRKVVNFCDYFVICTGNSTTHVRAIADGIEENLHQMGVKLCHKQGARDSRWIVLDLGDVVCHAFDLEMREFYDLDHLWEEAKKVSWKKS